MAFFGKCDLDFTELVGGGGRSVVGNEVALAEVGEEFGEGFVGAVCTEDFAAGFGRELEDIGPGEIGVAGFWIFYGLGGLGVFGDDGVEDGIGGGEFTDDEIVGDTVVECAVVGEDEDGAVAGEFGVFDEGVAGIDEGCVDGGAGGEEVWTEGLVYGVGGAIHVGGEGH